MRWLSLIFVVAVSTGCCADKIITVCPQPTGVPAQQEYLTDKLPPTIPSAAVVKAMLQDLVMCQDTEEQLRAILKGYEK